MVPIRDIGEQCRKGFSDFAGAGTNVVAKGVSIAQYRDDKSRRRIAAYDTFEEKARIVYNESFSIAEYAIRYAVIMHDEDRYRKMKKESEKRYCFAGYDKEVGDIEIFLDNLDKPHLRTWREARRAADTLIACRRFLSRKKKLQDKVEDVLDIAEGAYRVIRTMVRDDGGTIQTCFRKEGALTRLGSLLSRYCEFDINEARFVNGDGMATSLVEIKKTYEISERLEEKIDILHRYYLRNDVGNRTKNR